MRERGELATALGAAAMLVLLIGALVVAASADRLEPAPAQRPGALEPQGR
ncbi:MULTISPECIES: hypothetical protein [unclassified Phenylobacterium]|jgi:hypothetical protein|nr:MULTISPECIES: hypothetical protein [unclassified Phenylobacterium]